MTTSFFLVLFTLLLVAEIGILIYKIYQVIKKFDKLYDFFIRSEKDLPDGKIPFNTVLKGIPPMNGECPTKEELDNNLN